MVQPPGLMLSNPNLVCKLQKSLYVLNKLVDNGLLCYLPFSSSMVLIKQEHVIPFSLKKVLIFAPLTEINNLKAILDKTYKIKDLGDLNFFLGFEIAGKKNGISMNQRKYALDIISDACLLGCKHVSTPMISNTHLYQDDSPLFTDVFAYRRLIGRLIYLTNTRSDITFSVQQLAQFMAKPTITHHNVALRVLKYLKGSPSLGMFFPTNSTIQLKAYSVVIELLAQTLEDP
ncbi:unnamed protein product [Lupinus luteus]|uniref:Reverse transcriptase Ty1/copia-type domain-containing protein n=1 Tax=Lupinus luteus TaxID=3873 RepID=A0AAV1W832_LUPLU